MAGKFEIYKDTAGGFRFRLKASNGEKLLASEPYAAKASAKGGIASVQSNACDTGQYEKYETATGHRFKLKAKNGETIGTSETYSSAAARDNGIDAVCRAASGASTEDLT